MGHYCRICGRQRPNEQFSGKGHAIHVCKRCKAMPKSERQVIENMDDIFRFMRQSHISEKNVARLEQMVKSENPQVASLAAIVLKVARVKPYRARKLKFLAQRAPGTAARIGRRGPGSCSQLGLGDGGLPGRRIRKDRNLCRKGLGDTRPVGPNQKAARCRLPGVSRRTHPLWLSK